MVKDAHNGLCIQVEYYHVVDCVIRIWKSPSYIEIGEKPLIEIQSDIETAPLEAIILLDSYLHLSKEKQSETKTLSLNIINDNGESIYD